MRVRIPVRVKKKGINSARVMTCKRSRIGLCKLAGMIADQEGPDDEVHSHEVSCQRGRDRCRAHHHRSSHSDSLVPILHPGRDQLAERGPHDPNHEKEIDWHRYQQINCGGSVTVSGTSRRSTFKKNSQQCPQRYVVNPSNAKMRLPSKFISPKIAPSTGRAVILRDIPIAAMNTGGPTPGRSSSG
jgi:hypothetical protein